MQMSDVIADMLTRIRNANNAKHPTVDIPASNMKKAIAEILVKEGYVKSYEVVENGNQGIIRITLKYLPGKGKVIRGIPQRFGRLPDLGEVHAAELFRDVAQGGDRRVDVLHIQKPELLLGERHGPLHCGKA